MAGTPPTDAANLAAWYQFNVGITSSGGLVSAWADQSGNGRIMSQTVATNQPTLQTDGSILFDGVDNFLKTAAFTLNQPTTIYMLAKQVTWTEFDILFDGVGISNRMVLEQKSAGVSPALGLYAGTLAITNSDLALDTYGVVAAVFNGASSLLQVNNGSAFTGNPGTDGGGGFTLGASFAGSAFSHIQVKEVALFAAAHTADQRATMYRYLNEVGRRRSSLFGGEFRRSSA